jgi:transposase
MDMINQTQIVLAWELYEQGVPKLHIAHKLRRHQETIHLWIKAINNQGLLPFLSSYEAAKKGPRIKRQTDGLIKRWVFDIRKRELDCCGEKIQYFLQKEKGVKLAVSHIYDILHEKYILRSKWQKNKKRGAVPKASKPREVIQMDSIDLGGLFAFTGVDIFTKEADILIAPALTSIFGKQFLHQSMKRRFNSHVELLQTDGGSEFKLEFKKSVFKFCNRYRIARPYKKNEQSFIESFNRTVRKECVGWNTYRQSELIECQTMVESFLQRYHYHRLHMGLNMKPPLSIFQG